MSSRRSEREEATDWGSQGSVYVPDGYLTRSVHASVDMAGARPSATGLETWRRESTGTGAFTSR